MPRPSSERVQHRCGEAGSKHPAPPSHLSTSAQQMWKEIVEARPSDYFKPGALHLLEQFCEIMVVQRDALVELSCATVGDEPGRLTAAVRVVKDLGTVLTTTATKLRITVQGESIGSPPSATKRNRSSRAAATCSAAVRGR